MNVVDSSAWIEYFAGRANALHFRPVILDLEHLLVPALVLFEVYKWMSRQSDTDKAFRAVSAMRQGQVIELDADLAIEASKLSLEHRLPMAHSLIYVTAQCHEAIVWTQDDDFRDLPGVRYFPKSD